MRLDRGYKPLLIFSIFANLLMLAAPLHMLQVYDRVLASGSRETLLYITIIAAICLGLYGITEAIRTILAQRLSAQYAMKQADPLFNGMTDGTVPIEKSNEIIRNFNTVQSFIGSRSMIGLFDLPFSPVFLLLLYLLHFQLGIITTIGLAILVGIAWINKTTTAEDQDKASHTNGEAIGFASAIANRSEDIRAMGLLQPLVQRWGAVMGESLNAKDSASAKSAYFFGLSKAARQILQIIIMAWGAWLVLGGDMSGGMIFAASMISQRALQPVEQVIGGWDQINRAKSAHKSVEEALGEVGKSEAAVEQPEPVGNLKISQLSLRFEGKERDIEVLENVSFSAEPGQLVAIVGPSGAGKSSIARIVAGAMDATSGEVTLDGCLQKNWSRKQWGEYVGYVGQEINLFPGTIAENIARMATAPDEKRVVEAATKAGAHALINSFPDGYMTRLGGSGVRLSGGQTQRIALARALYTEPKLLILDEPNAHLDQEGENILMQSLQNAKEKGVTILVVAQRQQILRIADKVLLIKDGKQVPLGNSKRAQPKTAPAQGQQPPKPAQTITAQFGNQTKLTENTPLDDKRISVGNS
ncbi:MAG: type I secretion system permease/ATPase [Pseudomonadota bacterium]